jgi:hypothetical protein
LRSDIRKFGKDTPSLLEHVYRTPPMLNAAPLEYLDFSVVVGQSPPSATAATPLRMEALSATKKTQFSEGIRALRFDPVGRTDPGRHDDAILRVSPLKVNTPLKPVDLPVAAMTLFSGEVR